jgi:hypothetical protein
MRAGIWSCYRATTPIEQTGRVASSSFDPGGGQCALCTSETTDRHTVHCCSHYHVTTMMAYSAHLPAPIFDALPHLTTFYHICHITTSTTSTPTTLRLQRHDDDSPPLRTASTAGYQLHYTYYHLLPLQLLLTPPLLLPWRPDATHSTLLLHSTRRRVARQRVLRPASPDQRLTSAGGVDGFTT